MNHIRKEPTLKTQLRETPLPYPIWGEEYIDQRTRQQMDAAMTLPISVAGALMPDAHLGYGLPIGGVLATEGAVIPYAVGVDIACRMKLTIYRVPPTILKQQSGKFKKAIEEQTLFGAGGAWPRGLQPDHAILDDPAWNATGFLNHLKDKAYAQLGTSGSGNHFVEWGAFTLSVDDIELGLEAGEYLALLSHSGSRGVGYQIADRFSKLAMEQHPNLDKSVKHLAWLTLDSELGEEYWISMELAGRFAAANHEVIHRQVTDAAGIKVAATVENHHNFAWKEHIPAAKGVHDTEREVIIHRKGATPAGKGILGIIPGSMGDPGYVVRGKGNVASLNSASHGAGRQMSRRAAKSELSRQERDAYLKAHDVILLGGDLDEAPQAYKNIDAIMQAQHDLVEIVGKFTPRIVRMDDGDKSRRTKQAHAERKAQHKQRSKKRRR